jgi:hypothetical protein
MADPHQQPPSFNWREVKQEAIAGLITLSAAGAIGGIGYIAYTVPSKLDHVIKNQEEYKGRIVKLEDQNESQEVRIIRLELRK